MERKFTLWRQLLYLSCLILSLLLAGCGGQEEPAAERMGAYQVTDTTGTTMTFKEKPTRIASLSVGTDEILLDLVAADRIQMLTHWADDPSLSNVVDKAKAVPHRFKGGASESLLSCDPDLILVADYTSAENYQTLRDVGVNVYVYKTPSNLEEIKACIREVAAVVGEREQGEILVQNMERKMEVIQQQLGPIPPEKQKSVLHVGATGAYYTPKGTFRDVCRQALVKDATGVLDYGQTCLLSQEVIVSLNPDSFVIADWNYDGKNPPEALRDELLQNQSYSTTTAGKNGSVIAIPAAHLLSCSHYFVLAVEDMARANYPERF